MRYALFFLLLIIALVVEATLIQLPLVLILLILTFIYHQDEGIFIAAFISGLLLDALTFQIVGSSSIYFIVFLLVLLAYRRKFEIHSLPFSLFATLLGASGYLLLFGSAQFILQLVGSLMVAGLGFFLMQPLLPTSSQSQFFA